MKANPVFLSDASRNLSLRIYLLFFVLNSSIYLVYRCRSQIASLVMYVLSQKSGKGYMEIIL